MNKSPQINLDFAGIFLQVCTGGRILLGFRVGMNKPCRATNSVAKSLILRRFSLLTLLDLGTPQSTQKHHYLTPWLHSSYTGSATCPQSDE